MENEICKKKTAAPDTSVGADDGQPLHNSTENSNPLLSRKSTVIFKTVRKVWMKFTAGCRG